MSLNFYRKALINKTLALSDVLKSQANASAALNYPDDPDELRKFCTNHYKSCEIAVNMLQRSSDRLSAVVDKMCDLYQESSSKDKKKLDAELDDLDEETQFQDILSKAEVLIEACLGRMAEIEFNHPDTPNTRILHTNVQMNPIIPQIQTQNRARSVVEDDMNDDQQNIQNIHNRASSLVSLHSTQSGTAVTQCRSVKPPKMSLPKFNGNSEDFAEYWAIFECMVHNSDELSTIEKVLLLKDSLINEAAMEIKGITLVPENYNKMIDTLKRKYGDQSTIQSRIVQKLMNLPVAKDTADDCTRILNEIKALTNQMVSSGYNVREMKDVMWIENILHKFPSRTIKPILISNNKKKRDVTVDLLLSQLDDEISSRVYIESRHISVASGDISIESIPTKDNKSEHKGYGIKGNLNIQKKENNNDGHKTNICIFCGMSGHRPTKCKSVTNNIDRQNILMEYPDICQKCFKESHDTEECNKFNCFNCGKSHHTSICIEDKMNNHPQTQNNIQIEVLEIENANKHSSPKNRKSHTSSKQKGTTNSPKVKKKEQIVSMTTEGFIYNNAKRCYSRAQFLFTSDVKVSMIKERFAKDLQLPVLKTANTVLSGSGGSKHSFQTDKVAAKLANGQGEVIDITLQTNICVSKPIKTVNLRQEDKDFVKSNDIFFNTPYLNGEFRTPVIVIGLDWYSQLVRLDTELKMPSGLHIAKTMFGSVVYGKGYLCSKTNTNNANKQKLATDVRQMREKKNLQSDKDTKSQVLRKKEMRKECVFCQKEHLSRYCDQKSPDERRNIVIEKKLCWKCFGNDHRSNNRKKYNCMNCSKRHHSSLCNTFYADRNDIAFEKKQNAEGKRRKSTVNMMSNTLTEKQITESTMCGVGIIEEKENVTSVTPSNCGKTQREHGSQSRRVRPNRSLNSSYRLHSMQKGPPFCPREGRDVCRCLLHRHTSRHSFHPSSLPLHLLPRLPAVPGSCCCWSDVHPLVHYQGVQSMFNGHDSLHVPRWMSRGAPFRS